MSQHMDALARANEIRFARLDLKRKVRFGLLDYASLLNDMPACMATAYVGDVLTWGKGWGVTRAKRVLAGISPLRQMGHLTDREITEIVARIEGRTIEAEQKAQEAKALHRLPTAPLRPLINEWIRRYEDENARNDCRQHAGGPKALATAAGIPSRSLYRIRHEVDTTAIDLADRLCIAMGKMLSTVYDEDALTV